jgi:hypothetical protein
VLSSPETLDEIAAHTYGVQLVQLLLRNNSPTNASRIFNMCKGKLVELNLTHKGFLLINAMGEVLEKKERLSLIDELLAVPSQVLECAMHRRGSLAIQHIIRLSNEKPRAPTDLTSESSMWVDGGGDDVTRQVDDVVVSDREEEEEEGQHHMARIAESLAGNFMTMAQTDAGTLLFTVCTSQADRTPV